MFFRAENKGVFFIAVSQFGLAFSFHWFLAFIPFISSAVKKFQ
jgi:hypothetical protein